MSVQPRQADAAVEPGAPAFHRVLLKLSGEALMGDREYGIDLAMVERLAAETARVAQSGVETAIVVGEDD